MNTIQNQGEYYLCCMRIIMVCLGNICRSPLAEGILRHKLTLLGLKYEVDSAGTANYHVGSKPDPRSIQVASNRGIDISKLRGRQFTSSDFDTFDYILVMDKQNQLNVKKLARNQHDEEKIHLLCSFQDNLTSSEVPDPYYGTLKDFEKVYDLLDEVIDSFITKTLAKA